MNYELSIMSGEDSPTLTRPLPGNERGHPGFFASAFAKATADKSLRMTDAWAGQEVLPYDFLVPRFLAAPRDPEGPSGS